jgi:hypothetical protein
VAQACPAHPFVVLKDIAMSVKKEFEKTMEAVERVLDQNQESPRAIRESIKQLVTSYQAKDVVRQAYQNFADSGVMQWKTFLRAANVKQGEELPDYVGRIRINLSEMQQFNAKHLKM